MRYADLDVTFNDKEIWKTDFTEINKGPRWLDIVKKEVPLPTELPTYENTHTHYAIFRKLI